MLNQIKYLTLLAVFFTSSLWANPASESPNVSIRLESGFLSVLDHTLQLSKDNTNFDYVKHGSQDNLYSLQRFTGIVEMSPSSKLLLVYQPIEVVSKNRLQRDLKVENVTFKKGTPMRYRYSFPYYRGTYLWNLVNDSKMQLWGGFGLQLRNANIEYEALDGSMVVSTRDVGPVPLFSLHGQYNLGKKSSIQFEMEGNYANFAYLNGDDESKVKGAILDAAIAWTRNVNEKWDSFIRIRYVGGGAEGSSDNPDTLTGDGYASNWIDLLSVTAGVETNLLAW